jgi:hypothetical protein
MNNQEKHNEVMAEDRAYVQVSEARTEAFLQF